jgi:hydrogenase maturation protease
MYRIIIGIGGMIVGCTGVGLFIAIGTYVWTLKEEVNRQTNSLTTRANEAGQAADHAIKFVRDVISQAEQDLDIARKHVSTQPKKQLSMMEVMIARKASQDLAGSVERAHGAVVTASDTVVIAEAALKLFSEHPELKTFFNIQSEQVGITQQNLEHAASELRQIKSVLGVVPFDAGTTPTHEQLNEVDEALRLARTFTDELSNVVGIARGRVNDAKTSLDWWALRIAVVTSIVCTFGVIGQLFVLRFSLRAVRGMPV